MKKLFLILSIFCFEAKGAVVSMAFGENIPPFCFPETSSGIEIEIISEALAYKGHTIKPEYFPLGRIPWAFKNKLVDAAMTDLGQDMTAFGASYGDPAVVYDNVLITVEDRGLKIKTPSDLKNKTVSGFQGALNRYPDWLNPSQQNGNYTEESNQELQVLTLNSGHYDVILMDKSIFRFLTLKIQTEKNIKMRTVVEHPFTKIVPSNYRPVFWSKTIRDDFNFGIKKLKQSGRFNAIYGKYLKQKSKKFTSIEAMFGKHISNN